jgi:hypothetical protein
MEKEDYLEVLEKIKEILEFGEQFEREEDEEHKLIDSLKKDYNDFFFWALGEKKETIKKNEMSKIWEKIHPGLPLPRIFQIKTDLGKGLATVCFFMDAYPLYLANED